LFSEWAASFEDFQADIGEIIDGGGGVGKVFGGVPFDIGMKPFRQGLVGAIESLIARAHMTKRRFSSKSQRFGGQWRPLRYSRPR
jgi:hypothetical protein